MKELLSKRIFVVFGNLIHSNTPKSCFYVVVATFLIKEFMVLSAVTILIA